VRLRGPGGLCARAPDPAAGSAIELAPCGPLEGTPSSDLGWTRSTGNRLGAAASELCIAAPGGAGEQAVLAPCATVASDVFLSPVRTTTLCLGAAGVPNLGAKLQWQPCATEPTGAALQKFSLAGSIRTASGTCLDVTSGAAGNNVPVVHRVCSSAEASQVWDFVL
jgi:hypothetical protein